jgi:hypothetical protein
MKPSFHPAGRSSRKCWSRCRSSACAAGLFHLAPAQPIAFRRRDIDHGAISEAICADMATHCRFGHRDSEQKRDSVECKCEARFHTRNIPNTSVGVCWILGLVSKFSPEKLPPRDATTIRPFQFREPMHVAEITFPPPAIGRAHWSTFLVTLGVPLHTLYL